jgi:osmotically-inducible protein OsmY
MKIQLLALASLVAASLQCGGAEISTFHAYIDSDLCARLMLGPITDARVKCSTQTYKEGSNPVVVRLKDNIVLSPNKEKLLKAHVGGFAEVSGEAKVENGTVKLESVKPEEASAIAKGDPGRNLMDAKIYETPVSAKTKEKVRHELAMMPYISVFDFISFTMIGDHVILTGWTVRQTNRSEAFNRVKSIEGVASVTNNIEILPLGSNDMQIRAGTRAALQRVLGRYFWGSGSDIKIVVKNGNIILLGQVATKADSDLANIQANGVSFSFHVFNMLRVTGPQKN